MSDITRNESRLCGSGDCRNEFATFLVDQVWCGAKGCNLAFCSLECARKHQAEEHPGAEVPPQAALRPAQEDDVLPFGEPLAKVEEDEGEAGAPTVDDTLFEEEAGEDPPLDDIDQALAADPSVGDEGGVEPAPERSRPCDGCGVDFKESRLEPFEDKRLCTQCFGGWTRAAETEERPNETAAEDSAAVSRLHGLVVHPAANLFPMMSQSELEELAEDIRINGLRDKIVLTLEQELLDGRNRLVACEMAGVEAEFRTWDGIGDPFDYVVSTNLRRRHLDESQRAMVAAKLKSHFEEEALERMRATQIRPGTNRPPDRPAQANANLHSPASDTPGTSAEKAAHLLNVSARSVATAAKVLREGSPELVTAVEKGDVAVSTAADLADLPAEEQTEIVARGEKEIVAKSKEIRERKARDRKEKRLEKLATISAKSAPLSPNGKHYPVILADPPWKYSWSRVDCWSVEEHYPTMTTEAIARLPIAEMATPDAALFLWTTSPKLPEALRVIEAWGFTYVSQAVWDKGRTGMGYWFHGQHEILLIATRGEMPTPPENARPPSVIREPRGKHSAKPDRVYEIIERMYPKLPKLELFARGEARRGWSVWGNEVAATEPESKEESRRRAQLETEAGPGWMPNQESGAILSALAIGDLLTLDLVVDELEVERDQFVRDNVRVATRFYRWLIERRAEIKYTPRQIYDILTAERQPRINFCEPVEKPAKPEPPPKPLRKARPSTTSWKPYRYGTLTRLAGDEKLKTIVKTWSQTVIRFGRKSGAKLGETSYTCYSRCPVNCHKLPAGVKQSADPFRDCFHNCTKCGVVACGQCGTEVVSRDEMVRHEVTCDGIRKRREKARAAESGRKTSPARRSDKCPGHELSQRVLQGGKVFADCIHCGAYCCKYCMKSIAGPGVRDAHNRICEKRPRPSSSPRKSAKRSSTRSIARQSPCPGHEVKPSVMKGAKSYDNCIHCGKYCCKYCKAGVGPNEWRDHRKVCTGRNPEKVTTPPDRSSACTYVGCNYPHVGDASRLPGNQQHKLYRKNEAPAGYWPLRNGAWLKQKEKRGKREPRSGTVVDPNTFKTKTIPAAAPSARSASRRSR